MRPAVATEVTIEVTSHLDSCLDGGAVALPNLGQRECQQKLRLGGNASSGEVQMFGYTADNLRSMQHTAASLDIRLGSPPIHRFENLIYDPNYHCLYDQNGNRVLETCVRRGPRLERFRYDDPASIQIPRAIPRLHRPVVFIGDLKRHWGFFLLQAISRLWPLSEIDALADAGLLGAKWEAPTTDSYDRFLHYANIGRERFVSAERTAILSEVFVPHPSFVQWSQAYSRHFALPERIAERICGSTRRVTDQPVYLSRSRLGERKQWISGEEVLEEMLRNEGVRIVYPETMPFEDQVQMVNRHKTFIGCIGSAFHNLMFTLPDHHPQTIVLEVKHRSNHVGSFAMIDLLKGIRANYIQIKSGDDEPAIPHPSKRYQGILNARAAMAQLRAHVHN